MIKYYSTNKEIKNGYQDLVTFKEALLMGMAPDNGLFMPTEIPKITKNEVLELKNKPYKDIAFSILKKFLKDEISDKQLKYICDDAYNFEVPIENIDKEIFLVRMGHGPTASFKDFAARFMARAMHTLKHDDKEITILVATSGDTGSAVGQAFHSLKGIRVFILYPRNEVSPIQKKQLDSIGDNVTSIAVDSKFDDCQKLLKQAFADPDIKKLNLTTGNSINIGRILPQIVYYFYSYAHVAEDFEELFFSIPSGNFGNSLGCELARRMGLPVKLLISVNENDEFPVFLDTEKYKPVFPSKSCLSNSMNVGNPSNLARYFNLYGGIVDKFGVVHKQPSIEKIKEHITSISINDDDTIKTINEVYKKYNILLEPHGAVGVAALFKYFKDNNKRKSVVLETAHPAKFPEVIEEELGIKPEIPNNLKKILKRKSNPINVENNYKKIKEIILNS